MFALGRGDMLRAIQSYDKSDVSMKRQTAPSKKLYLVLEA